jgi:hypothetical protein
VERGMRIMNWVQVFFVHKRIISVVKRIEFISNRMSLRVRWCDIIVLKVQGPTEDKINDINARFYEELEHVFDKFPKYRMKISLGDFNAKVDRDRGYGTVSCLNLE